MDDPGRVELRALCLDPDDPRWDGPVAARKEGLEAAREMVGNAAQKAREVRDKVQASEAAQAVAAKAREARAALGTNAGREEGPEGAPPASKSRAFRFPDDDIADRARGRGRRPTGSTTSKSVATRAEAEDPRVGV